MEHDLLIVGGGPAGLATAFWHQRRNPHARVRVLEAGPRPGGWVHSERRDGFLCENGPQAVRPTDEFDELVAALGIQDQLVPASAAASARWVGRDGHLLAAPAGPLSLLTSRLLSFRGKWRLLRETRAPSTTATQESMSDFCARRFGAETVPLVQAMVGGVFAGDADRLEVDSAFPMLTQLEREHGSVFAGMRSRRQQRRQQLAASGEPPAAARPALVTFRTGMSDLPQHLCLAIGDALQCDAAVDVVQRHEQLWSVQLRDGSCLTAPRLVLACPAHVSARLLAETAPELAAELAAIKFASLASVYLGFPLSTPPKKLRGFGFLLTREPANQAPGNQVLGAIYASQIFPDHAPPGHTLVRVMMGGALHPETVELGDEDLVKMATDTIARYTGVETEPTFRHIVHCRRAIPQYEQGHGDRLRRVSTALAQLPGLHLRGNSYRGVAVTAQLHAKPLADDAEAIDAATNTEHDEAAVS